MHKFYGVWMMFLSLCEVGTIIYRPIIELVVVLHLAIFLHFKTCSTLVLKHFNSLLMCAQECPTVLFTFKVYLNAWNL